MHLFKRLFTWSGTCRAAPVEKGIAHYIDAEGRVVTWAWTFSDEDNLIIRDDKKIEKQLVERGYKIIDGLRKVSE